MSAPMIPSARAREQRERSRDVCDDVTNAVRAMIESMARAMRRVWIGFGFVERLDFRGNHFDFDFETFSGDGDANDD